MINPIAPHGPPVQPDSSGVPVSTRDKGSGSPSFDDFLPDQPAKETPSPIEDHSPPPVLPDTTPAEAPTLDPIRGMMPRPIRWKESKATDPSTTPGAGAIQPDVPPPTDPQLLAMSIALSPSWSPLSPPAQENEATATETSSARDSAGTQVSTSKQTPSPIKDHSPPPVLPDTTPAEAPTLDPIRGMMPRPIRWKEKKISDLAGTNAVFYPGVSSVQTSASSGGIRRMKPDGVATSTDPAATATQASPTVVARQSAPVKGTLATPDLMLPIGLLNAVQATSVPAFTVPSTPVIAADFTVTDLDQTLPLPPDLNASSSILTTDTKSISLATNVPAPTSPGLPASSSPMNSREVGTDLVPPSPTTRDLSATLPSAELRATNFGVVLPLPTFRDLPATGLSADTGPADANLATPTTKTDFSLLTPVADSRLAAPVAPPVEITPPMPAETTPSAPMADSRPAVPAVPPVPVETTPPVATMTQGATVTFSASSGPAERSTPPTGERAKIAGLPIPEIKSTRKVEGAKSQVTDVEQLKSIVQSDGTPVAKDELVVNAVFSTDEKETDASLLPKRGSASAPGIPASSRAANGHSQAGETLISVPVSGPAAVESAATPVTRTSTPDPTATRQAVKVETLLQHTLSAGESVRPSGSDQMEMRVRLDGGHEDVTVRMQVVNDRMQVTFQTNSPELRKALEHGWEQFSADASRTSTLSMSEPRFETSRVSSAPPTGQADTQGFSSNQQNSRRQEAPAAFADELASSVAPRRDGFAPATTVAPAAGQSAARRWSGWA